MQEAIAAETRCGAHPEALQHQLTDAAGTHGAHRLPFQVEGPALGDDSS